MSMSYICVAKSLRCVILILALVANISDSNAILLPWGNQIPAIFNFGDSNSDTGSCSATFARVAYPNGITFFGNSSGRFCDGRLIIDFIAENLSLPYLSPYLDAMEADFKHSANFASAGTTITPFNEKWFGYGVSPLSLNLQLLQFQQFKDRVTELYNREETSILQNRLPKPEDFSKALYSFDIGQNDVSLAGNQAYESLPDLIDRFSLSIEQLHQLGARNFLIFNTGPLGCMPYYLEMYPSNAAKDEIGCLKSLNKLAQEFNRLLEAKVSLLQTKLQDSSLVYADIYSAKYSLIRDAKLYGFLHPFRYSCEKCLKRNNNSVWTRTRADQIAVTVTCDDSSKYISWDSEHYTEAANHWIVNKIFDGSLSLLTTPTRHYVPSINEVILRI